MNRFWSLLFFSVPILGTVCLLWAILELPPMQNHWLPPNINVYGDAIDHLFYVILWLTGITFIGTGLALGYLLWKYDEKRSQSPVRYVHGSHRAELIWSVVPGIILLFLSLYQIRPWTVVTMERPTTTIDGVEQPQVPLVKVIGRQFNWDFQYPGPDGQFETADDITLVDSVCAVPVNEDVVLQIESEDVLHSFFIPTMRLKQDVVPGMRQFVWFNARETGEFEIACTELCGWGHYKMRAKMLVLSRSDYDAWIREKLKEQNLSQYAITE